MGVQFYRVRRTDTDKGDRYWCGGRWSRNGRSWVDQSPVTNILRHSFAPGTYNVVVEVHTDEGAYDVTRMDWLAGKRGRPEEARSRVQLWLDEAAEFTDQDWEHLRSVLRQCGKTVSVTAALISRLGLTPEEVEAALDAEGDL